MMTENNNPVVMTWFQQQQTPAGWFDLLIIMIEGMLNNAGELESQPFLRQMGASLAETHPLPASETVGDLEANINRLLTHFHWGVVTIDVGEDGLRLRHQAENPPQPACSLHQYGQGSDMSLQGPPKHRGQRSFRTDRHCCCR